MYLELFKLHELPFRLTPDPAFLYLSKHHARAKAYMESTIWFTDGFVVITGEIGSGKTTLIETFLKELERDVVVAHPTDGSPLGRGPPGCLGHVSQLLVVLRLDQPQPHKALLERPSHLRHLPFAA
jgi:hypothetical protein